MNDALELVEIDSLGSIDWFLLTFDGMYHPCALASFYKDLPGVRLVEPNWVVGDGPNVFPRATEQRTSFLVNEAWGDCPAGCIENEYWYFEVRLGEVTFRGKGRSLTGEWGTEAQTNINFYQHLSQCPAE